MALTLRSITEDAPRTPAENLEVELAKAAAFTRKHTIASIYHAGSGHPGGALSSADLLACLFGAELNFWPNAIDDPGRDRFVVGDHDDRGPGGVQLGQQVQDGRAGGLVQVAGGLVGQHDRG